MGLLNFDVPKKLVPTNDHNAMFQSDSGVGGTYVPNMSNEDMHRWKANKFNIGKKNARIELRKTFGGTQVLVLVALAGWDYKHETVEKTKNYNVRISNNGPIIMSLAELTELNEVVNEAIKYLQN